MRIALVAVLATLALPATAAASEWPEWGNDRIDDCAFAAAADWEMIALHRTPSEAEVIHDFYAAGGRSGGIAQKPYERWLRTKGIAGVRISLREVPGEDALSAWDLLPLSARYKLEKLLAAHLTLIAEVVEGHMVVVSSYNATGPVIITYGATMQMTWPEWREQVWALFIPGVIH